MRAAGGDADAEVVAWLHDVVEDTGITLDEIERDFGPRIADDADRPVDQSVRATPEPRLP